MEDGSTQQLLAALGGDQAQGFVIAEPMPLSALIEWLRTSAEDFVDQSAVST